MSASYVATLSRGQLYFPKLLQGVITYLVTSLLTLIIAVVKGPC